MSKTLRTPYLKTLMLHYSLSTLLGALVTAGGFAYQMSVEQLIKMNYLMVILGVVLFIQFFGLALFLGNSSEIQVERNRIQQTALSPSAKDSIVSLGQSYYVGTMVGTVICAITSYAPTMLGLFAFINGLILIAFIYATLRFLRLYFSVRSVQP